MFASASFSCRLRANREGLRKLLSHNMMPNGRHFKEACHVEAFNSSEAVPFVFTPCLCRWWF